MVGPEVGEASSARGSEVFCTEFGKAGDCAEAAIVAYSVAVFSKKDICLELSSSWTRRCEGSAVWHGGPAD